MMMDASNASSNVVMKSTADWNFFFNHVYLLLLVIIGAIGNTFVIIIFGQKAFRTTIRCVGSSLSVYPFLFYMAISDTLYLVILFCLWLSNYINVLHRPFICQLTLYLTYVCNFINAYYTVAYTAQRLFAVVKPFRVSHVLSWYRSRCLALTIIVVAGLLYSYLPFLIGIVNGKCYSRPEYRYINQYMDVVDCVIVFLIPYLMIIIMNTVILVSLRRMKQNQEELFYQTHSQFNQIRELTRRNASRKMTKLLLTVSTSYLIICAPYACIHSWRLLVIGEKDKVKSEFLKQMEYYFLYVYHISFAMNFYIYIVFGSKFRRELKRLFNKSQQSFDHFFRERKRCLPNENEFELNDKHSSITTADEISTISPDQYIIIRNYCCCCHFQVINH